MNKFVTSGVLVHIIEYLGMLKHSRKYTQVLPTKGKNIAVHKITASSIDCCFFPLNFVYPYFNPIQDGGRKKAPLPVTPL